MFSHVKSYLDEFERLGIPGMDISVWYKGKEVFRETRGVSDENGTPMSGKEKFNIYSCSKVITCVAALLLVEEGKLCLDDEIALYLPAFANMYVKQGGTLVKAEKRITVRHLFTMTAGLNYDCGNEAIKRGRKETDGKSPTVEMMKYIAQIPLDFEPGTTFQYSLCHDVLAAVVEIVSGKRFGQFVKERIFDPLEMFHTTFLLPDEELSSICAQYRFVDNEFHNVGRRIQTYKLGSEYESGGAGAISTVEDYIRFLEALRTGRLLKEDTLALMRTNHLNDNQRSTFWPAPDGYSYGLGVRVPCTGFPRTDFGWGGAAGASLAIDPEHEISFYYAQHVLASPNGGLRKDLIEAVKLDLGYDAYVESMWQGKGSTLA